MPLVFGIAVDLFVLMPIRSSEYKNGLVINVSQVCILKKKTQKKKKRVDVIVYIYIWYINVYI
jgi:hypothetical protein